MIRTVIKSDFDVNNFVTCKNTVLHCALDTGVDGFDEFFRNRTARYCVDKLIALARLIRFKNNLNVTVLTRTARLSLIFGFLIDLLADSLFVGNLRSAYVCLNLELTQKTVNDDSPMPAMIV